MKEKNVKHYYRSSAWTKLHWRRILSLQNYLKPSVWFPQQRLVKLPGKKHSRWLRMMPSFRHCSTVNVKTLPYFVKRVSGLSPRPSVREHSDSLTSVAEVRYPFRYRIMVRKQAGGPQAKARPSTCKTSSEVRSYAKRLWLPMATNSSSAIYRRLSHEFSHGFQTTQTCWTSSGPAVILMPRSVRRCSTYPALVKSLTLTFGSLRRARCLAADTVLAGRLLLLNSSRDSLGRRRNATTWGLRRSWGSPSKRRRSSLTGK